MPTAHFQNRLALLPATFALVLYLSKWHSPLLYPILESFFTLYVFHGMEPKPYIPSFNIDHISVSCLFHYYLLCSSKPPISLSWATATAPHWLFCFPLAPLRSVLGISAQVIFLNKVRSSLSLWNSAVVSYLTWNIQKSRYDHLQCPIWFGLWMPLQRSLYCNHIGFFYFPQTPWANFYLMTLAFAARIPGMFYQLASCRLTHCSQVSIQPLQPQKELAFPGILHLYTLFYFLFLKSLTPSQSIRTFVFICWLPISLAWI